MAAALLVFVATGHAQDASAAPATISPADQEAERKAGTTTRVSVGSGGEQAKAGSAFPVISADGTCVAFASSVREFRADIKGFVVGTTVFVRELKAGRTDRLDVEFDGKAMSLGLMQSALSADGNIVAAYAVQEMAPADARIEDIVVFDRRTRDVKRADPARHGIAAPLGPYPVAMSGDGSAVVFQTTADFARQITRADCYVFDVPDGAVTALLDPQLGLTSQMWASLSGDGRWVAFAHMPTKPDDERVGTYVLDRRDGAPTLVSTGSDRTATKGVLWAHLSADGRFIAYVARDDPNVPGDSNGHTDVFVLDRETSTTELVTVAAGGGPADDDSDLGAPALSVLSADGRFVVFTSEASNLVPDDTNGEADVFVRDRTTGRTQRVSLASNGAQADSKSIRPSISADGRRVAFESKATNLVPDDTNGVSDVFVHEVVWSDER